MAITGKRVIKIGKILHGSPIAPNILIGKVTGYIEEGTVVYDEKAQKVGVVLETFGPVNSPFVRIKTDDASHEYKGHNIFIMEREKKDIMWRKKPKKRKRYNKGKRG